ncbi:MAG: serine/threonine protein kinase, partial [Polyangiaceae bacterium]|nr:serine/threonine protein kinase [Polyangiaceae bacterium]
IAALSPISIADALVELRQEVPGIGEKAASLCAAALRQNLARPEVDDGLSALARAIVDDLGDGGLHRELYAALRAGLDAFAEQGSALALDIAHTALDVADARISELESLDVSYDASPLSVEPRRAAMSLLREIDGCLLESRTLTNLLLLDRPPGAERLGAPAVDDLDARLARWLLDPRRRAADADQQNAQSTLQQRQLRALLHLIDGGNTDFGDDQDRRVRMRSRWALACRQFIAYLRAHPGTRLARAIIATVARAYDALVRDGAAEAVDVFLCTAMSFGDAGQVAIVAEASMQPDVTQLLVNYGRFVAQQGEHASARLGAFKQFLEAFPHQTTLRAEAFRVTAWTLLRALESVLAAGSLRALVPEDSSAHGPLAGVEDAIQQLGQLVVGAERRCLEETARGSGWLKRRYTLESAVDKALNTHADHDLSEALTVTARAADAMLPGAIAGLVSQVLPRISTLRADRPSLPEMAIARRGQSLPPWLPSRRILGGFYVINQIGGGNVGSVFVVKRAEERHDPNAERFALKVPDYNATAARSMSEAEFLRLFREEAGALIAIPDHPNIARFVTFDAGAKPKPILVMELIEGLSCERAVSSARLTTARAIGVLEGVLAGLEAMHGTGVAHLDVKPSNAILRETGEAVLVDFGLAGRKLRPGCATLCYGSPEVWEAEPGTSLAPHPSDIYAFGCFAYEVMTARTLFEGQTDVSIISAHLTHDGLPPPLDAMVKDPDLAPLARFLYHALRQNPAARATARELRRELGMLAALKDMPWPVGRWDVHEPAKSSPRPASSPRPPSRR